MESTRHVRYADHFDVLATDGRLSVTFLGVAILLVSDGTSAIRTDGFFSRPSLPRGAPATHRGPARSRPRPGARPRSRQGIPLLTGVARAGTVITAGPRRARVREAAVTEVNVVLEARV
jgi:hypothetical protein